MMSLDVILRCLHAPSPLRSSGSLFDRFYFATLSSKVQIISTGLLDKFETRQR